MSQDRHQVATRQPPPRSLTSLGDSEAFCRDLSAAAASGRYSGLHLRPIVHDQLVAILAKIDKPTAVLTGAPGVGKSCNVYALAHRMYVGDQVPHDLRQMRVLELDVAAFIAGAGPGELERRAVALCRDAATAGRGVLFFIDEVHTLLEARLGSLSLGDILKPSLARGEISCVAATTDEGYRRSFEADEALARRFQRVAVPEPDAEETLSILSRSVPRLAAAHRMLVTTEDLRQAITLSRRYVRHRANPDKANDLLDEAMALQRVEFERDPGRRAEFAMRSRAAAEAAGLAGHQQDARRLEATAEGAASGQFVPLDARYLGRVIHRWTSLPTEVLGDNAAVLVGLGERLLCRVVGQDQVVARLAQAVVRGLSGAGRESGPLVSAFLAGPTGVGKTETARALAAEILGSDRALLRIDGSELTEPHSVARLIGAPPGYVGFDQGGDLTGFVRDHPFGVIVVDEAEKANRTIHDLFLQILEEGQLQDGRGVRVDFSGQVILFTSNLDIDGSGQVTGFTPTPDETGPAEGEVLVRQRLATHLRSELVNRFDLVLRYKPLEPSHIRRITSLIADSFRSRMMKERALDIVIPDAVLDDIAAQAYNPSWGGREVRRVFDRDVADTVASWLVTNGAPRGGRVVLAPSATE